MRFLLILTLTVQGYSPWDVKFGPYDSREVCELVKGSMMAKESADGTKVAGECVLFEGFK